MRVPERWSSRVIWTTVLVLGGLVVVTSATTVALRSVEDSLTRNALREAQEWLDAVVDGRADALEGWLGSGIQMVRSVADYPGVAQLAASREGRHRVQEHLDTMVRSFGVHSAAVFDADGTELVKSTRATEVPWDELRPFEKAAITATPPVVLERHVSNGVAVTFRLPIGGAFSSSSRGLAILRHYPSKQLLAVLAAPVGTTQPVALRLLLQAEDGVVYALTAGGEVLPAPSWLQRLVPEFGGQSPDVELTEREQLAAARAPDQGFLTSCRPVRGADWWLVGIIERQPVLVRVERELRRSGAIIYLALIALASVTLGAWRHWRAAHYRAEAESQARFKTMFAGAPVPLLELDLSTAARVLEAASHEKEGGFCGDPSADPALIHQLISSITVASVNRSGLELLGAESPDDLERLFLETPPTDIPQLLCEWWRSVVEGSAEFEKETTLWPIGGGRRDVLFRVRNPENRDAFDKVLVGILDLTQARALEEQLRQAMKMEAVGRLAGGVAHDFNNLLQAMLVAAESLKVSGGDRARIDETATELGELIRRASALTRQLLLFSRRETARFELLDLNEVVLGVAKMLSRLVRENITFGAQQTSDRLSLRADRGQIEQILLNLVVNAVDAMPDGGKLVVRTAAGHGDNVILEVEDTGHGIPPEARDQVFEPFFTTKPAGEGTGLGLSVVHGIVIAHGGKIEIDSREGRGTTVRVVLPRVAEEPGSGDRSLSDEVMPGGRGEVVLIVEDNETVRRSLVEILDSLGYQVVEAESGEEALLMEDARPQVLLTDYLLPGMTGLQLAEKCRGIWPDLGVILISGYGGDHRLEEAVKAGTVRFIRKPVPPSNIARELRRLLDER